MTEFQELDALHLLRSHDRRVLSAELIFLIASAVSWVKGKIRKRKEAKKIKESATNVD